MSITWCDALESRLLLAVTVPSDFVVDAVASGLDRPTSLVELPDGRLLVTQKSGALRVIKSGSLLTTPAVTLPVSTQGESGLLGVAADPNFASNHYVYLHYFPSAASGGRISRFTFSGDGIVAGSELVLLDLSPQGESHSHAAGAVHFGKDGKLYVATGDNQVSANAQSLANTHGKLLRLNPDGTAPVDNPFVGVIGASPFIWSYGLRNPFTFGVNPTTGAIFLNDVGEKAFEEIDVAAKSANYGWPNIEGPTNEPTFKAPLYSYAPTPDAGVSITGGTFYAGVTQAFPAAYAGKYFFGDYVQGFVKTLDPSTGSASPFATGFAKLVDLDVVANGSVLVLMYDGKVQRIRYVAPTPTDPPSVTLQAEVATLSGGTAKASNHGGYTGSGFADYAGNGSVVRWTVNRAAAGSVKLDFRYANGATANRPLAVQINGSTVGTLSFPSTGSWSTWKTVSLTVSFKAGANTIKAVANSSNGGANVDALTLSTGSTPPPTPGGGGTGSINAYVVNDKNANGKWDSGETGLAGRTVWLDLDNDGVIDTNETQLVTTANGKFTFTGLSAGTYRIRQVVPAGWRQVSLAGQTALVITLKDAQASSGKYLTVTTRA